MAGDGKGIASCSLLVNYRRKEVTENMKSIIKATQAMASTGALVLLFSMPGTGFAHEHKQHNIPAEYQKMKNPIPVSQAVLAEAKAIYEDKCQKCHGEKGDGKGTGSKGMDPKPTNYTDKAKMEKLSDGELFYTTMEGSPDSDMNGWKKGKAKPGKEITEEEAWKLIHYIRAFAK